MGVTVKGVKIAFAKIDSDDSPKGAFAIDHECTIMNYVCPCADPTCTVLGTLRLRRDNHATPHPSWAFDGNMDAPTLNPSINHVDHWHGWLRAGVWESV